MKENKQLKQYATHQTVELVVSGEKRLLCFCL